MASSHAKPAACAPTCTHPQLGSERFDLKPQRLIGDTAHGTAPLLNWMVEEKKIEPHVPVWEKYQRTDGSIPSDAFHWDEERDEWPRFLALSYRRSAQRTHIGSRSFAITPGCAGEAD
jgi:hypothetical protein